MPCAGHSELQPVPAGSNRHHRTQLSLAALLGQAGGCLLKYIFNKGQNTAQAVMKIIMRNSHVNTKVREGRITAGAPNTGVDSPAASGGTSAPASGYSLVAARGKIFQPKINF